VSILSILLLSALGGLFGAMAVGEFGFGVGAFLGISCGVAISKFAWRLPTRDRYETLFARRKGTFVIGALFFGVIGGLTGLSIPAAAKWTIDFGGGRGWAEAGVAGRVIPMFIGLAVLGPIIGVAGASVVTFISESSNKNSYLASFDKWQKSNHSKA
jgi:hypothetical protein